MRALVTGGAGFVGSHVCELFVEQGYEVTALDDLSTGRPENLPAGVSLAQIDLVDGSAVATALDELQPDVVCHLAAQSSVTVSVANPRRDLDVNVSGTFNLLEAAKNLHAPLIFASTGGALYGNRAPVPTPEETVPEPLAPYGASKLAGEAYVGTWARLHGIPNVVLRLGNVYGPRQTPHGEAGVVAIFSHRIHNGDTPVVYGDGTQTRDYIHASDVAAAFLAAARGRRPGTFNVGWGQETTVLDILRILAGEAGTPAKPHFEPLRTGELMRSALDSTRLRELGWRPTIPLEHGIAETFRTYALP